MGQAKQRRNKFGQPVRSPVTYRQARRYLLLEGAGDDLESTALEASWVDYAACFHHQHPARRSPAAILDLLTAIEVPHGSYVLVDPRDLTVARTVIPPEFDALFQPIPGFNSLYADTDGPSFEVALSEDDRFVVAGQGVVESPIEFMEGKVRVVGDECIPSDWPFSLQIAGWLDALETEAEHDGSPFMQHLHQQHRDIQPLLADLGSSVNADAALMSMMARGEDLFDEDDDDHDDVVAAILNVVSSLDDGDIMPKGLLALCRNEGEGTDIVRPRHRDDPVAWTDFEQDAVQVSAAIGKEIVIGEEAWRGSFELGAVEAGGALHVRDRFLRFFDRGTVVGHVDVPRSSIRFDVIDVEDTRFLVKTIPGDLIEYVAWNQSPTEARSAVLEDEAQRSWASYRFVPESMARPERMRIEASGALGLAPSRVRLMIANLHGFDAWSDLEAAVAAGPASAYDEDTPAAEVERRVQDRSERTAAKLGMSAFDLLHIAANLRISSSKGAPSLKAYRPGKALFEGVDVQGQMQGLMDRIGFQGSTESFEDHLRSAKPVHPSAWIGLLEGFGWRIDDVDLSMDGESIGPNSAYFGAAIGNSGERFDLHVVPFTSPPGDEGDALLESIMDDIELDDAPAIVLQNGAMYGEAGGSTVLYGGQAWDGEEWWHFCVRPGVGVEDVVAQKGKDVELLSKKVAKANGFPDAKDAAQRLALSCDGRAGDDDTGLMTMMRGENGWTSVVFMPKDGLAALAALKGLGG